MATLLENLYKEGQSYFELGDMAAFTDKMKDSSKRKRIYDAMKDDYELGDYNTFSARLDKELGMETAEAVKQESVAGTQAVDFGSMWKGASPDIPQMNPQTGMIEVPKEKQTADDKAFSQAHTPAATSPQVPMRDERRKDTPASKVNSLEEWQDELAARFDASEYGSSMRQEFEGQWAEYENGIVARMNQDAEAYQQRLVAKYKGLYRPNMTEVEVDELQGQFEQEYKSYVDKLVAQAQATANAEYEKRMGEFSKRYSDTFNKYYGEEYVRGARELQNRDIDTSAVFGSATGNPELDLNWQKIQKKYDAWNAEAKKEFDEKHKTEDALAGNLGAAGSAERRQIEIIRQREWDAVVQNNPFGADYKAIGVEYAKALQVHELPNWQTRYNDLQQKYSKAVEPYKESAETANRAAAGTGGYVRAEDYSTEAKQYGYAIRVMQEAKKTLLAPTKDDPRLKSLVQGMGDVLTTESFWDLGFSTIVDLKNIVRPIYDKAKKYGADFESKMTDSELEVLRALEYQGRIAAMRAGNTSNWYGGGQMAAESIGFMAGFALTSGVSSGATALVKQGGKQILRKVEKGVVKKALQKAGVEATEELVGKLAVRKVGEGIGKHFAKESISRIAMDGLLDMTVGSIARMPLMPSFYSQILTEMTGNVSMDENGKLILKEGANFWRALYDASMEVVSESSGFLFDGVLLGTLGKLIGKAKIPWGKMHMEWMPKINRAFLMPSYTVLKKGGVSGVIGEEFEEVFKNGADAVLAKLTKDEEWMKDVGNFWTKDNWQQMIIGFGMMPFIGGTMAAIGGAKAYRGYSVSRADLEHRMAEMGISEMERQSFLTAIAEMPMEDLGKMFTAFHDRHRMSEEERKDFNMDLLRFMSNKAVWDGYMDSGYDAEAVNKAFVSQIDNLQLQDEWTKMRVTAAAQFCHNDGRVHMVRLQDGTTAFITRGNLQTTDNGGTETDILLGDSYSIIDLQGGRREVGVSDIAQVVEVTDFDVKDIVRKSHEAFQNAQASGMSKEEIWRKANEKWMEMHNANVESQREEESRVEMDLLRSMSNKAERGTQVAEQTTEQSTEQDTEADGDLQGDGSNRDVAKEETNVTRRPIVVDIDGKKNTVYLFGKRIVYHPSGAIDWQNSEIIIKEGNTYLHHRKDSPTSVRYAVLADAINNKLLEDAGKRLPQKPQSQQQPVQPVPQSQPATVQQTPEQKKEQTVDDIYQGLLQEVEKKGDKAKERFTPEQEFIWTMKRYGYETAVQDALAYIEEAAKIKNLAARRDKVQEWQALIDKYKPEQKTDDLAQQFQQLFDEMSQGGKVKIDKEAMMQRAQELFEQAGDEDLKESLQVLSDRIDEYNKNFADSENNAIFANENGDGTQRVAVNITQNAGEDNKPNRLDELMAKIGLKGRNEKDRVRYKEALQRLSDEKTSEKKREYYSRVKREIEERREAQMRQLVETALDGVEGVSLSGIKMGTGVYIDNGRVMEWTFEVELDVANGKEDTARSLMALVAQVTSQDSFIENYEDETQDEKVHPLWQEWDARKRAWQQQDAEWLAWNERRQAWEAASEGKSYSDEEGQNDPEPDYVAAHPEDPYPRKGYPAQEVRVTLQRELTPREVAILTKMFLDCDLGVTIVGNKITSSNFSKYSDTDFILACNKILQDFDNGNAETEISDNNGGLSISVLRRMEATLRGIEEVRMGGLLLGAKIQKQLNFSNYNGATYEERDIERDYSDHIAVESGAEGQQKDDLPIQGTNITPRQLFDKLRSNLISTEAAGLLVPEVQDSEDDTPPAQGKYAGNDLLADDVVVVMREGSNFTLARETEDGFVEVGSGKKLKGRWQKIQKRVVYVGDKAYLLMTNATWEQLEGGANGYSSKNRGMVNVVDAETGQPMQLDRREVEKEVDGKRQPLWIDPAEKQQFKELKRSAKTLDDILNYVVYEYTDTKGVRHELTLRDVLRYSSSVNDNMERQAKNKSIEEMVNRILRESGRDVAGDDKLSTNESIKVKEFLKRKIDDAIRVWNEMKTTTEEQKIKSTAKTKVEELITDLTKLVDGLQKQSTEKQELEAERKRLMARKNKLRLTDMTLELTEEERQELSEIDSRLREIQADIKAADYFSSERGERTRAKAEEKKEQPSMATQDTEEQQPQGEQLVDGKTQAQLEKELKAAKDHQADAEDIGTAQDVARAKAEVERLQGLLGQFKVIEDASQAPNSAMRNAIEEGQGVLGWYDGEAWIVLPSIIERARRLQARGKNISIEEAVRETVFHELVAHKGLKDMLGDEKFGNLCKQVWKGMNRQSRERMIGYAFNAMSAKEQGKLIGKQLSRKVTFASLSQADRFHLMMDEGLRQIAADEHIAHLAQQYKNIEGRDNSTFAKRVRNEWEAIVRAIREWLGEHGIQLSISDSGIADYIVESYDNLRNGGVNNANRDTNGTRYQIIGEQGATALDSAEEVTVRLDNLDVARKMEEAGKDARQIRLATGWERGADGKWRYEIPDIKVRGDFRKKVNKYGKIDLGDLINAPELFAAYPRGVFMHTDEKTGDRWGIGIGLGDMTVNFERGNNMNAFYSPENHEITLPDFFLQYESEAIFIKLKTYLAHEIQHAIQEVEGFAVGTDTSHAFYNEYAGEVEARNAESRLGMSDEERRQRLLEETEDVAREDQIILFDLENSQESSNFARRKRSIFNANLSADEIEDIQRFIESLPLSTDNSHGLYFVNGDYIYHFNTSLRQYEDNRRDGHDGFEILHKYDLSQLSETDKQLVKNGFKQNEGTISSSNSGWLADNGYETRASDGSYIILKNGKTVEQNDGLDSSTHNGRSDRGRRNRDGGTDKRTLFRIDDSENTPATRFAIDDTLTDEEREIRTRAEAEGVYMQAPNGEPTRLTEKQWLQVRTAAFKRWAGDWENDPENARVVLDRETGEPLVLYHGRKHFGFSQFDLSKMKSAEAIFFADNADVAKGYAGLMAEVRNISEEKKDVTADDIMNLLFSDRVPFATALRTLGEIGEWDVEHDGDSVTIISRQTGDAIGVNSQDKERLRAFAESNIDAERLRNEVMNGLEEGGIYATYVRADNVLEIDAQGEAWDEIPTSSIEGYPTDSEFTDANEIATWAKEQGYDGVFIRNTWDSDGKDFGVFSDKTFDEFIALSDGADIKSATENNGEFDGTNPDIRYMIDEDTGEELPENPMGIDPEVRKRIEKLSSEISIAQFGSRTPMSKVKLSKWQKWVSKALDRGEGLRILQKQINHWRKKNGLAPISGELDVRSAMENAQGAIDGRTKLFRGKEERALIEALQKVEAAVANSRIYQKYKNEKYNDENGEEKGKVLSVRDFIGRAFICMDNEERMRFGMPSEGVEEFSYRMGVSMAEFLDEFGNSRFGTQTGKELLEELHPYVKACTDFALQTSLDAGTITKDQYDEWSIREWYVPERDFDIREAEEKEKDNRKWQVKAWESARNGIGWTEEEDWGDTSRGNVNNVKPELNRRARGRKSLATNVFENVLHSAYNAIETAEHNKVRLRMWNLLRENADFCEAYNIPVPKEVWYEMNEDGEWVRAGEEPSAEDKRKMRTLQTEIRLLERRLSKSVDTAERRDLMEQIDMLRSMMPYADEYTTKNLWQTEAEKNHSLVRVMVNGTMQEMRFAGITSVANALNNRYYTSGSSKISRAVCGTFAAMCTQYNPAFFAVNVVRDIPWIAVKGFTEYGPMYAARFAKNIGDVRATRAIWKYLWSEQIDENNPISQQFHDFITGGGQTGYSNVPEMREIREALNKKVHGKIDAHGMLEMFAMLNESSELYTRFAAYRAVIDSGLGKEEALKAAKNLSVNFNRKGFGTTFGNLLSSLSMFANATIQGASGMYRAFGGDKGGKEMAKQRARAAVAMFGLPFVVGLLNGMFSPDDDDDEYKPSDWERMNYMCWGDVRVPLSEQLKPFYVLGVYAALCAKNQRSAGDLAAAFLSSICINFMPFPPNLNTAGEDIVQAIHGTYKGTGASIIRDIAVPQGLHSINQLAENKNFLGGKLKNEYANDMPQYMLGENASAFARDLSYLFYVITGGDKESPRASSASWDVNPKEIDEFNSMFPSGVVNLLNLVYGAGHAAISEDTFEESVRWKDVPIVNRFYKPKNRQNYRIALSSEASRILKEYDDEEALLKKMACAGNSTLESRLKIRKKDGDKTAAAELKAYQNRENNLKFFLRVPEDSERAEKYLKKLAENGGNPDSAVKLRHLLERGDEEQIEELRENLEKYKAYAVYFRAKSEGLNVRLYKHKYPDRDYDNIDQAEKECAAEIRRFLISHEGVKKVVDDL